MFTANVERASVENNKLVVVVTFTDGVSQKFQEILQPASVGDFNNALQGRLNILNAIQDAPTKIPLGPFVAPIVTPPAPTPLDLFRADLAILRNYQNAIDLGVITNADPGYTAQSSKVQKSFDPSFLGSF